MVVDPRGLWVVVLFEDDREGYSRIRVTELDLR